MNVLATMLFAIASMTTTILGVAVAVDAWKTRCDGEECSWPQRLKPCFEWFLAGLLVLGDGFVYLLISHALYVSNDPVGWFDLFVSSLLGFFAGGTLFFWMRDKRAGRR